MQDDILMTLLECDAQLRQCAASGWKLSAACHWQSSRQPGEKYDYCESQMNSETNTDAISRNQNPDKATDRPEIFYVVSIKKFSVLYIATLGLYGLYWFYKNWACYKRQWASRDEGREDLWPIGRALFAVFFVHALFRAVKAHAPDKPTVAAWENGKHATQLVLLLIAAQLMDRLAYRDIGSPYTDILSLIILAPLLWLYVMAQEMINASCNDPRGDSNRHFTGANYAWIILGALFWCFALLNYLLPEA